jgi:hypothetical protein
MQRDGWVEYLQNPFMAEPKRWVPLRAENVSISPPPSKCRIYVTQYVIEGVDSPASDERRVDARAEGAVFSCGLIPRAPP